MTSAQKNQSQLPWSEAAMLALGLLVFLFLRVSWVGHLITWDEALNLCSARAFYTGGSDAYSAWFWRHPPLFNLSLLTVSPLQEGFMDRAQLLTLGIWGLALAALYFLNRRAFGIGPAVWATLALAVMPGARFFDLWIKQEPLLVLCGLLALLAQAKGRPLYCGLFLGLAFLCKEFALFFAVAVFLLWLAESPEKRRFRDLAMIAGVVLLLAGWWYLLFSNSLNAFVAFATGLPVADLAEIRDFSESWDYFYRMLTIDLGWPGILLAAVGLGSLVRLAWPVIRETNGRRPAAINWWPVAFLVPAWIVLSLSKGKAPWFLMSLYPALATLQGIGIAGLISRATRKPVKIALILLAGALLSGEWLANRGEYEAFLHRRLSAVWWHGPTASREAAMLLNELQQPGENVLLTPYYFYPQDNFICPILTAYLKPMPVLVRGYGITPDELLAEVKTYDIHWALIAPDPKTNGEILVRELRRRWQLYPMICEGGILLYHTADLSAENLTP